MAAGERYEYHWIENRIVGQKLNRPKWTKKWRFRVGSKTLIATIEPRGRSFYLRAGPATTDERIVDCIRHYKGYLVDHTLKDFSKNIPSKALEDLSKQISDAIESTLDQWDTFAEETDVTGYLKGRLSEINVELGGWRIAVRGWTYKRNPKEEKLGVDLGIIFDVISNDKRIIKAVWFQAKIIDKFPNSLTEIPDLEQQIGKMLANTKEAYTLIYTKEKIVVCHGLNLDSLHPLSQNLIDGISCVRGDRNPELVANTADVKQVLTFFITGPYERT